MRTVSSGAAVAAIRDFNRYYTRQLGLLDRGLLGSEFSLTEARLLYELANRSKVTASDLHRDLNLDFGYLSRLLRKFEARGLLQRMRSTEDARQKTLKLTRKGRAAFAPLNRAAKDQVDGLIRPLPATARADLLMAMQQVRGALTPAGVDRNYEVRALQVGDLGWIIHRQGLLYAREYGFDLSYEALVAEILAGFAKNFDPALERAWIVERAGNIAASVFMVRESAAVAKLRLLYVEPSARGLGIGRDLVNRCIAGARACGYTTLTLWTNDVLISARRIYEAAGFQLVSQAPHRSFGKDLLGQTWELALHAADR